MSIVVNPNALYEANQRLPAFFAARVDAALRQAGISGVPLAKLKEASLDGLATACTIYVHAGSNRAFGSFAAPIILGAILEQLTVRQVGALPFYLRRSATAAALAMT